MVAGALIQIDLGAADGAMIRQSRPHLGDALVGRRVDDALRLAPLMLPVCGAAQRIAAERAVEAARCEDERPARRAERERALRFEQAAAAAWRLAIDWPALIGAPPEPLAVKAVRMSAARGDAETAADALAAMAPETSPDVPLDMAIARLAAGDSLAARLVQATLAARHAKREASEPDTPLLAAETASQRAATALAADAFDPKRPMGGGAEVGALAMARDPRIADARAAFGRSATARLIALLLDGAAIAAALRAPAGSPETPRIDGVGLAMTARGPLAHRVRLDGDVVAEWRMLAPTDWHFASDGPAAAALAAARTLDLDQAAIRRLVASFDPCAEYRVSETRVFETGHA